MNRFGGVRRWCLATGFVICGQVVFAQEVEITPRVELSLAYTDNVRLATENRESDIVAIASPGLRVASRSRRVSTSLEYFGDYVRFLDGGGDEWRHNLFGLFDIEAVENSLFFTGRANIRQAFLDRRQGLSISKANRSENRRTVQTYLGGVRSQGRIKNLADWQASYRYGQTLTGADDPNSSIGQNGDALNFSDSQTHEFDAGISSGERFSRLNWRINAGGRRVIRSRDVRNFESDRVGGEISYRQSQALTLLAGVGWTDNNVQGRRLREDGLSWHGGFELSPSRRTKVAVRGGKEGNRQTWDVSVVTKPTRRTEVRATYQDSLTAVALVENQNLAGQNSVVTSLNDLQSITSIGPIPAFNPNLNFSLSDLDFRQQALTGTVTWFRRRTQAELSGLWERRTFAGNVGQSKAYGGSFRLRRQLDERTSLDLVSSLQRNLFNVGGRADTTLLTSLEFRKSFARNIQGVISYGHSQRFSNQDDGDLRENAVTLTLRAEF